MAVYKENHHADEMKNKKVDQEIEERNSSI
jgi:hypothetical protein